MLSAGGRSTKSGVSVSEGGALTASALYGAVRIFSEDVAKLPLILYRRLPGRGKERATDHPLYSILHDAPNDWQTSFEWRHHQQAHQELRGESFCYVNRVGREVRELIPLETSRVTVRQLANWDIEYDVRGDKVRKASEILHVRGFTLDGLKGVSILKYAAETLGLTLATQNHGAKLFANGARASGALRHPETLSDGAAERLKRSVEENLSGDNVHRILLLEEGMEWTQLTMTAEDSQFLETRKFQLREFARFFRIPPHKLADLEQATFSNIEHQSREYVDDSLMPRLVRWEQRLNRTLLTPAERKEFYVEFLVDNLLRGDTKTRYAAYKTAIDTGWMNPNEARERENMNREPGLDEFRRALNTEPVGSKPREEEEDDDE